MPLQKILFKPGVNRENTRYTTEGGWYECDKVRFRQGNPEKIGGWTPFSLNTYLGVCRSLWNWITLAGLNLVGVGTNLKFYICSGSNYYDITPLRGTGTYTNNLATTSGSADVVVTAVANGCNVNDFVTITSTASVGGLSINGNYQVKATGTNTFTIQASSVASSTDAGGGGTVTIQYEVATGSAFQVPVVGWGAGKWGASTWGVGGTSNTPIQIWNQMSFGENLLYGPRGGGLYYWTAGSGLLSRGVNLASIGDASTPIVQNYLMVSDASRFVLVFGTNDYGSSVLDPMLVRWSDQENPLVWIPDATNQAGSLRLSHGSKIVTVVQTRQELVTFTDQSVYSLQYLGPPYVWGSQLLGDNISIASPQAAVLASGIVYWMGVDKFYKYDGRVQTLNCDLRRFIFQDINMAENLQIFGSTVEAFNEVWWFYCSANSFEPDRYVVYNYVENIWYYGSMVRTAWLDSGLVPYPIAATANNRLVNQESGVDANENGTPQPIEAYISSSEFDIGDGHNFGYIWRVLPDLTFSGSSVDPVTGAQPQVTMSLYPMASSGSGTGTPGVDTVNKVATYGINLEEFTGIVYTRVRGRQLIFKIDSTQLGTTWQLGAPRIDIRPDGRR